MEAIRTNRLIPLLKEFIESYAASHDTSTLSEWLSSELKAYMPKKSDSEIQAITDGIISSVELNERKRESLNHSLKRRHSKEEWIALESGITIQKACTLENSAIISSVSDVESYETAERILNEIDSPHAEFIDRTLASGNDTGLKVAAAGALKACSEHGIIPSLPAGTPETVYAGIAYIAIGKLKATRKKLAAIDFIEEIERETAVVISGTISALEGALHGSAIGAIFGPAGAALGGFIGGVTGMISGKKKYGRVLKTIRELRQTVKETIAPAIKRAGEAVITFAESLEDVLA